MSGAVTDAGGTRLTRQGSVVSTHTPSPRAVPALRRFALSIRPPRRPGPPTPHHHPPPQVFCVTWSRPDPARYTPNPVAPTTRSARTTCGAPKSSSSRRSPARARPHSALELPVIEPLDDLVVRPAGVAELAVAVGDGLAVGARVCHVPSLIHIAAVVGGYLPEFGIVFDRRNPRLATLVVRVLVDQPLDPRAVELPARRGVRVRERSPCQRAQDVPDRTERIIGVRQRACRITRLIDGPVGIDPPTPGVVQGNPAVARPTTGATASTPANRSSRPIRAVVSRSMGVYGPSSLPPPRRCPRPCRAIGRPRGT